jgi:hypothetical protein
VRKLKFQLTQAQNRMKKYADQKRTERHFSVGDWVYLKLQPYRQISLKGNKGNHNLCPKFYGPFEIVAEIDKVTYQLNLPAGSLIHPIFHVSQLKKKVGPTTPVLTKLPLVGPEEKLKITLIAILDIRVIKKNNAVGVEVLVQWANLPAEEASWEDYHSLIEQFPGNCLEDKINLENGILLAHQLNGEVTPALVTVEDRFEMVNAGKPKEDGLEDMELSCSVFTAFNEPTHNYISVLTITGEE